MNSEVDREIEAYRYKFEDVQQELADLDAQIASYENQICEKDSQIEGMKTDLVDAETKKREQEEAFK